MKPYFPPSSRLKAASATLPGLAHPLDLGEGRRIRSTTVICVRRGDSVVMAADGQVSLGSTIMKGSAKKIRRLYNDKVLAGFAGSTADAFSLFARFETKLEQYAGNLGRAAVELAKDWRTDKMLRQLEALLIVADPKQTFLLSGTGDVIDPDEGIATIGSGGFEWISWHARTGPPQGDTAAERQRLRARYLAPFCVRLIVHPGAHEGARAVASTEVHGLGHAPERIVAVRVPDKPCRGPIGRSP